MSGHSKWSKIKRSKGVADAKRGQMFTKLGREISIAVREGGPDPEGNFRLRLAIQKCRENNMLMDNVNSAIKRASGAAGGGAALQETSFEGYGPKGTAILAQAGRYSMKIRVLTRSKYQGMTEPDWLITCSALKQ